MLHLETELMLYRAMFPPLKRVWIKDPWGHRTSKGRCLRLHIKLGIIEAVVRRDGRKTSFAYPITRIEVA